MSWPTSYQQQLPSSVPPGWNDPPSIAPGAAGSRLLRQKRLVDPSINGSSSQQFGVTPGQPYPQPNHGQNPTINSSQPYPNQQGYQQPMSQTNAQYQPPGNQGFRLTPQLLAGHNKSAATTNNNNNQRFRDIHRFLPKMLILLLLHRISDLGEYINSKITIFPKALNFFIISLDEFMRMGPTTLNSHQPTTTQTAQKPYRPVYDAFSVNEKQRNADIFSTRKPINSTQRASTWTETTSEKTDASQSSVEILKSKSSSSSPQRVSGGKQSSTAPTTPTPSNSLERQQTSLIYSAPNCITESTLRGLSSIDPTSYKVPVKAAGDVSLTGNQCVAFLTKATLRLHPVKCEGVQLRLASLRDQITNNAMTEPCIKKLNFVVDAIDREQYEEASNFFDQLQQCFPTEMGTWTLGLKLLISELRRSPSRTGSAGSQRLRIQ